SRRQCRHGHRSYPFCNGSRRGRVPQESQRPNLRIGQPDYRSSGVAGSAPQHRRPISGPVSGRIQKKHQGRWVAISPFSCLEDTRMVAESEDFDDESLAIDCPVLITERLVMRPPHEDDIADLAMLANNRRIAEMLSRMPHPYGVAEAQAF